MFDLANFRKAEFKPRERELKLAALKSAGFGDGVIKVRGLTAHEIAQADEAATRGKLASDLVEKLAGASGKEKAAALLEGVGISGDVPALLAKRYEHVKIGVVEPALDLADVVKFGDTFPIEFSQVANTILELTGQGQEAIVKPRGSGKKTT